MAAKPLNERLLEQLRDGTAEFELVDPPVPSIFTLRSPRFTSPFLCGGASRFFARIGWSSGDGVSPATRKIEHYSVQKVTGDGRCMFRALVKGMAINKGMALSPREERDDADELRIAVKEVICESDKERHQYEEALVAITVDESLKRYCLRIERSDFWGGESELLVLSKICHQPIIVYIPEREHVRGGRGTGFIPIAEYGAEFSKASKKSKPRKAVRLLYSGFGPSRVFIERVMDGPSNGGMLYHEVQESKLCAVHCVNTVLQGPFFSEFDLAALASDLDRKEHQMMLEGNVGGDFVRFDSEESHNVSMDGDFSIQVLQKALEVWDLQVIPLDCPVAEPAQIDPELENAFICHLQDHWFSIRKVNGEWYNFDSLYAAPEHLSKFYLSAYLDSLKGFGWSIFLVRGNFPKDCPISSADASNGFGQWLSPEDAQRITKSCNSTESFPQHTNSSDPSLIGIGENESLSDMEDEDLKAAIAASLIDSSPAIAETGVSFGQTDNDRACPTTAEDEISSRPSTETGISKEDKEGQ